MKTKFILFLTCAILLYGCGSSNESEIAADTTAVSSSEDNLVISSAAKETSNDSTRKFIRTADLKFRVKDVVTATYEIEDITVKLGGFVTLTNLESNTNYMEHVAVSADSTLELTHFSVSNTMTIRVPNTKLDTTLKCIAKLVDFLDHRIIKADDVAIQMFANDVTVQRIKKSGARVENDIDAKGGKLRETISSENVLENKQEQIDNALIANKFLKDKINFSTISIYIYQKQLTRKELTANVKNIEEYEPHIGLKILYSLKYGWNIFESIVLFFVKIWGLLLIALALYFLYRWNKNRKNKSA